MSAVLSFNNLIDEKGNESSNNDIQEKYHLCNYSPQYSKQELLDLFVRIQELPSEYKNIPGVAVIDPYDPVNSIDIDYSKIFEERKKYQKRTNHHNKTKKDNYSHDFHREKTSQRTLEKFQFKSSSSNDLGSLSSAMDEDSSLLNDPIANKPLGLGPIIAEPTIEKKLYYEYIGNNKEIHGPWGADEMQAWYDAKHLPADLPIRVANDPMHTQFIRLVELMGKNADFHNNPHEKKAPMGLPSNISQFHQEDVFYGQLTSSPIINKMLNSKSPHVPDNWEVNIFNRQNEPESTKPKVSSSEFLSMPSDNWNVSGLKKDTNVVEKENKGDFPKKSVISIDEIETQEKKEVKIDTAQLMKPATVKRREKKSISTRESTQVVTAVATEMKVEEKSQTNVISGPSKSKNQKKKTFSVVVLPDDETSNEISFEKPQTTNTIDSLAHSLDVQMENQKSKKVNVEPKHVIPERVSKIQAQQRLTKKLEQEKQQEQKQQEQTKRGISLMQNLKKEFGKVEVIETAEKPKEKESNIVLKKPVKKVTTTTSSSTTTNVSTVAVKPTPKFHFKEVVEKPTISLAEQIAAQVKDKETREKEASKTKSVSNTLAASLSRNLNKSVTAEAKAQKKLIASTVQAPQKNVVSTAKTSNAVKGKPTSSQLWGSKQNKQELPTISNNFRNFAIDELRKLQPKTEVDINDFVEVLYASTDLELQQLCRRYFVENHDLDVFIVDFKKNKAFEIIDAQNALKKTNKRRRK
eukprot:TRINITY_DN567_c0_g1_i1.p1 TRINITY_DN567_c0_g1~~TRINITY_DN567_c0_g1_i1.p1  ORF type:complete len:759 (+),score=266.94 TRINITY_DN567_c0_g1_i1:36-2279(+)